ncbi:cytochrome b5 [Fomitiporia mediterranea MF3/22]|uniref:cytochrome b5 n=1 Tax=Fomitiporia mediterranea (strain MF3/22) TaxID=694068 RepID=UPI0004409417|nr:cytochrome b5 [Fomitiporia mediterranea MF3/22]EJD07021.1 cytochrome b5 [Fomitiporia mediterranea MF3/22]
MSAYLRSWLSGTPFTSSSSKTEVSVQISTAPAEENNGDSDADSDRTDTPPVFPAPNSAQRLGSSSKNAMNTSNTRSSLPKVLMDTQLMPPPPPSANSLRVPGVPTSRAGLSTSSSASSNSLMPPPTVSGTLRVPPSTTKPSTNKFREKVALAPGFGPLDWAALKSSGADLRGVDDLLRITPSMLKEHNKKDDAWAVFYGKVYNITPYLPYHPGGEKQLMRVAGRDGTKLFASTHAWVNVEFMLDACLVGFLVSESYGS